MLHFCVFFSCFALVSFIFYGAFLILIFDLSPIYTGPFKSNRSHHIAFDFSFIALQKKMKICSHFSFALFVLSTAREIFI